MLKPKRYFGVDVAKDTLVVACENHRWQFQNSKAGHRQFIAQIRKQKSPVHVVCEATGPYHLVMCLALQEAGIAVSIANPQRVHHFARFKAGPAKNDGIDAKLIEEFAKAKEPPADPPLSWQQVEMSEMVAHRRQLVESLKVFRTHRQQIHCAVVGREMDRSMKMLQERIKAVEDKLLKMIKADPLWAEKFDRLKAVKGVGLVTAVVLLVKMPELGSLNRGQCGALSGSAPYDDDSGTHHGKRSIRGGRFEVRKTLYMASLSAIRVNPTLKKVYQALVARQKPAKVALVAVMRKLIIYLNTVLKAATMEGSVAQRRPDLSTMAPL